MERFAVLSDVHGNRWALEAVLADLDRLGVADVVNLGDTVYGPLDPAGTADLLMARDWPTARGNQDRILVEPAADEPAPVAAVRARLGEAHLKWLADLPLEIGFGLARGFHGTPDHDETYLLQEVVGTGARLRAAADVEAMLGAASSQLVLCGHDHVPRTMVLPGGTTVVNPGSVGLPAYVDDWPSEHVMETGAPHARYAVVERAGGGWTVADRAVPYDWQAAAAAARENGRDDWAAWLTTGRG